MNIQLREPQQAFIREFKSEDKWRTFVRAPSKQWLLMDAWFETREAAHAHLTHHGYEIVLK